MAKIEIFGPKSNRSEIFNPDSSKHECPLCPRKYSYRKDMKRHVKMVHLLSLPDAFELSQNISDGVATVDDIPGNGSRNTAPENS